MKTLELLRAEAVKRGKMGSEDVTVKVLASEVNVDELPDFVEFEKDGEIMYLSCEAENLY